MKKSFLLLLIALTLIFLIITACSGSSESVVSETQTLTADVLQSETTDGKDKSGVPDSLDLGGEKITVWYTADGTNYTDIIGEQTGDVLDDAVFSLNLTVQEKLNCVLNLVRSGVDQRNCKDEISKILLADDTTYDLYFGTQWSAGKLVAEGLYLNVSDAPYLSFDKPWWDLNYMKEMSVGNDKIYTLIGDYAIDRTRYLTCVYFNKQMYNNFYGNPDGLYDIVLEGNWDWDKLKQISADVYQDINNDSKLDRDDRIGTTLCWNDDIMSLLYCSGARITERDSEGIPIIVMNNDYMNTAFTDLLELARHSAGIFFGKETETKEAQLNSQKFANGSSMFMFGQFATAELLREMTDDYGIVPIPKHDSKQEIYRSTVYEVMRFMALPYNCRKVEASCALLEQMAFEGYSSILPVYYDTALKTKYVRDDVSAKMIDMIRENLTADIAVIYGSGFGGLCYAPRELIGSDSANFASKFASLESAAIETSEKLIAQFQTLN